MCKTNNDPNAHATDTADLFYFYKFDSAKALFSLKKKFHRRNRNVCMNHFEFESPIGPGQHSKSSIDL